MSRPLLLDLWPAVDRDGEGHSMTTTLTFTERFDEMHTIGLPDWQIAKRMGMSLSSLERQLARYDRPVSNLLRDMAREERES